MTYARVVIVLYLYSLKQCLDPVFWTSIKTCNFVNFYKFLIHLGVHHTGIKGDQFFTDLGFFLALVLHTNWCTTICITCPILCQIERIKFVSNKFVLVLVQIDLIGLHSVRLGDPISEFI
jgi:hypothetical protein